MSNRSSDFIVLIIVLGVTACTSTPAPNATDAPLPGVVPPPVLVKERTAKDFAAGVEAMRAERYSEATRVFTELTEDEPSLSGPWANLGVIHREHGDIEAAEAAFKRAVDLNPKNCAALNELGVIARERGDFLTAEASYLQCVKAAPDFRNVYLNLGILYELYLGRYTDALDAYRTFQTLSVAPDERVQGWMSDLERRLVARSGS